MAHKVCPRCGARFATLKSATCPQCFAHLVEVDEETAAQMAAEQAQRERTPEYQEAKAEEDERFRHESFQACLGVVALTVGVIIFGAVMIVEARNRHAHAAPVKSAVGPMRDPMPRQVGMFRRKEDQQSPLSGTLSVIYHAVYNRTMNAESDIDVYAIPITRPAADQTEFRNFAQNVARMSDRDMIEAASGDCVYEIEAPATGPSPHDQLTAFLKDWAAQTGKP